MDLNEILPGQTSDRFSWSADEHVGFEAEIDLQRQAQEFGFFEHAKSMVGHELPPGVDDFKLVAPDRIRQLPHVVNICGLVSATPQAVQIPESVKFLKVETSGRVWLSSSSSVTANASQTLAEAANQYSVAIVGNGEAKILDKPLGLSTLYLSAYPDNSEVSLTLISGEVVYRDVR